MASVVEEKLLGIEEGPDEIFVGLPGQEKRVDGFGLFIFFQGSGCRWGLVFFLLQIIESSGEFFGSGRSRKRVEVKLSKEVFGSGLFLFGEMSGS
jgi:hypothetical protein